MSWANKIHKQNAKEARIAQEAKQVLEKLQEDEHYRAMDEELFERHKDFIREQLQTIFWCCFRVALKDEGISDRKANTILALADSYTGQDMTMDEFRDWCIKETGVKVLLEG